MKEKVRVSLVQFAPTWLDRDKNAERMRIFAEREAQEGSELIVFPELANIGYITPALPGKSPTFRHGISATEFGIRYVKAAESIPGPTTETLGEVSRRYGIYIIVGIAQLHPVIPATLYNSAVLIGPYGVIGVHQKVHLPANEKLLFYAGNTCEVHSTELGNISMVVCYDLRFPELSRIHALGGAEIICAIYSMPRVGKNIIGDVQTLKYKAHVRAQENSVYCLVCDRTGREGDVSFAGHSAIAAPDGQIIAYSESDQEEVIRAELHNEELIKSRIQLTIFRDRRPDLYAPIVETISQTHRVNKLPEPTDTLTGS
ncbi:carbon-nitrogen hydrolase family protein [Chloroflexota bacterium]